MLNTELNGAELVQPGTTSASQAEGRGFKSRTPHFITINFCYDSNPEASLQRYLGLHL